MSANVHVLMTVYNEEPFLEYAIKACLPYVRSLTIVEGAYQEVIALGQSPRSTDKTVEIAKKFVGDFDSNKVTFIQANKKTDSEQRNVGLESIKERFNNDGWLLIIDGDEVYKPVTFRLIQAFIKKMDAVRYRAAYFTSLTFVNDLKHYCIQEFPRLFKISAKSKFINDNFMSWGESYRDGWHEANITRCPLIRFHHYSFCKGKERFDLKKKWWETRFGQDFDYSWHLGQDKRITDSNHRIQLLRQSDLEHPEIMKSHPMWKNQYDC